MKGTIQAGFGDPREVLSVGEVDVPAVEDDGVLVRVRAASIHIGSRLRRARIPEGHASRSSNRSSPRTAWIGQNMAGIVEAVGPDVTQVAVGDEVFGSTKGGVRRVRRDHAGGLGPEAGQPDVRASLGSRRVGVHSTPGAALPRQAAGRVNMSSSPGRPGVVGTFAVQIAKAMGAEVTGVCSTRNLDLVRSIGAEHVIDYTHEDFTRGEPRYDLILDNVGAHSLKDMRRVLTHDDCCWRMAHPPRPAGSAAWVTRSRSRLRPCSPSNRVAPSCRRRTKRICTPCGTWLRTAGSHR